MIVIAKKTILSLAVLLAACSAEPQSAGDHAVTPATAHDTQRLYGIHVKAAVLTATQKTAADDSQVVTADLEIVDAVNTFDGSQVSGNVEVIIAASDPNHGLELQAIRPGATIQAFVSGPVIDRTTNTIVAQTTPYQASLVQLLASP